MFLLMLLMPRLRALLAVLLWLRLLYLRARLFLRSRAFFLSHRRPLDVPRLNLLRLRLRIVLRLRLRLAEVGPLPPRLA